MVASAGAGPEPIPHAALNPLNLAEAICFCLRPEASAAAQDIAIRMKSESGVATAVNSFHRNLPLDRMRCNLIPGQPAAWAYTKKKQTLTLSKAAMNVLIEYKRINAKDVKWSVGIRCAAWRSGLQRAYISNQLCSKSNHHREPPLGSLDRRLISRHVHGFKYASLNRRDVLQPLQRV